MLWVGGKMGGRVDGGLVVGLVAALSERAPFVFPEGRRKEEEEEEEEDEEVRLMQETSKALRLERFRQWRHPTSDALSRLWAVGAYTYASSKGM